MTDKLYRYSEDFGRMGHLTGIFVADDEDVARFMGRNVYWGEALGKHSDITGQISHKTVVLLDDDPVFITRFLAIGAESGYDPIDRFLEYEDEMEPEEEE